LSFVILTRNSERTLGECLKALVDLKGKTRYAFEVIIVDGGSTDSTLEIARKFSEILDIKVLSDEGRGLGYARDIGWRSSRARYVIMLDSDVVIGGAEFVEEAVNLMENDLSLGAVASKLKPISVDRGWLAKFQEKNLSITLHMDERCYPHEAVAIHTACTVFRREALEKIGGFDHYFTLAKEDSDVSYRLRKAGYRLAYLNYFSRHIERARVIGTSFRYRRSYVLISRKHPNMEPLWRLKNAALTAAIFLPLFQPLLYIYYLLRYRKVPSLTLIERIVLPLIELIRQDVRTLGMLYQLLLGRIPH